MHVFGIRDLWLIIRLSFSVRQNKCKCFSELPMRFVPQVQEPPDVLSSLKF